MCGGEAALGVRRYAGKQKGDTTRSVEAVVYVSMQAEEFARSAEEVVYVSMAGRRIFAKVRRQSICEHKQRFNTGVRRSGICEHGRQRSITTSAGDSGICEHSRQTYWEWEGQYM
jgi:hypothetical protein